MIVQIASTSYFLDVAIVGRNIASYEFIVLELGSRY